MKLPTLATQGPSLGLPRTSGSASGLILASRATALGENASAPQSAMVSLRSRILPAVSTRPGFSLPDFPYRTSFMTFPQFRPSGALDKGRRALADLSPARNRLCNRLRRQVAAIGRCRGPLGRFVRHVVDLPGRGLESPMFAPKVRATKEFPA